MKVATCLRYGKVRTFSRFRLPPLKLSMFQDTPMTADYAWDHREGMNTRYAGKRVGGTIVVHFIKKNMWFLETALALLDMDEVTELEQHPNTVTQSSHLTDVHSSKSVSTHYTTSKRMRKR